MPYVHSYKDLPSQSNPFPSYPGLQTHLPTPPSLMNRAFTWHWTSLSVVLGESVTKAEKCMWMFLRGCVWANVYVGIWLHHQSNQLCICIWNLQADSSYFRPMVHSYSFVSIQCHNKYIKIYPDNNYSIANITCIVHAMESFLQLNTPFISNTITSALEHYLITNLEDLNIYEFCNLIRQNSATNTTYTQGADRR